MTKQSHLYKLNVLVQLLVLTLNHGRFCLSHLEFDRTDLLIYAEVARMPPFQRKSLVLIGAQGVGRRTLKQRLIKADSTRFGSVIARECSQTLCVG